ncbi:hypothetical protein AB0E88_25545 [Streptomyces sp. NPDC028635]|uniref:hypothetical protein n=1 Tax=Streptomyces sp. NPDC028635 TaxID=3154800 RepID=UPI0033DD99F8
MTDDSRQGMRHAPVTEERAPVAPAGHAEGHTVAPPGQGETVPGLGDRSMTAPGPGPASEPPTLPRDPDARGETATGTTHGAGPAATAGTTATATAGTTATAASGTPAGTGGATAAAAAADGSSGPLMPHEEVDEFHERLSHTLAGFVDGPRDAVEEADRLLQEITAHVTDAVSRRRRTLRMTWQGGEAGEDKPATGTDTEQLRLALRDYRELSRRLLHL